MKYLFEFKEYKKPKSIYYTKRIPISKLELENICKFVNLPFDKLKFLASGSLGNAYKIDDKVIKITTDKREAYSISKILDAGNKSIIKYYSVNMYKLKNNYVYIIVMDYVLPLKKLIKDKGFNVEKNLTFVESILDIIYKNWETLKTKNDFLRKIRESDSLGYYICTKCKGSGLDDEGKDCKKCNGKGGIFLSGEKLSRFDKEMIDKLWNLYQNIKGIIRWPDLHIENIGVKNDELLFFDFTNLMPILKFDSPAILK